MAGYVDGFLVPMKKKNVAAYRKISLAAGKIWKEYGALEYRECVGDDLKGSAGSSFAKVAKLKPGETVFFSWIVYRSKQHRDRVNAKVMADPRISKMMEGVAEPFDMKRMSHGGFRIEVDL